jgi:hypothetical protein
MPDATATFEDGGVDVASGVRVLIGGTEPVQCLVEELVEDTLICRQQDRLSQSIPQKFRKIPLHVSKRDSQSY